MEPNTADQRIGSPAFQPTPGSLPHGSLSPWQHGGQRVPPGAHGPTQADVEKFLGQPQTHDKPTAKPGSDAVAAQPKSLGGQVGQTIGDIGRGIHQEGVDGLLDPAGMMDRQQAQRDLSNRFQVVPDNFKGPRKPNQVTDAEYERIAHTFSDIRLGRGDLTINTSEQTNAKEAAKYKQGTLNAIADMMMTKSGREEIERLHDSKLVDDKGKARLDASGHEQHHHTEIRALYNSSNGDPLDTNNDGKVDAKDKHDAVHRYNKNAYADATDTTKRGDWFRKQQLDAHGNPVTDAKGKPVMDRGVGTDSTIWWNPTVSAGNCNRSDVILAHEMAHSIHETQGTMASGTVKGGPDNGINNFERQAVGLPQAGGNPGDPTSVGENAYREERNALGMGDKFLPRTRYSGTMPGQATTAANANAAWKKFHHGP